MPDGTCSIEGCGRPQHSRGWCGKHYQRWRNNGDPLVTRNDRSPDLADRLARRLKRADNGCLEWCGSVDTSGYGIIGWRGRNTSTHRAAWVIQRGPIPPGFCVLHRCDNPRCCEPTHLFLGDRVTNNQDRARKGRSHRRYGEETNLATLTEASVREIRELYATGSYTQRELGERFGVTQSAISNIVILRTWSHIA